ncbi:MAG: hypothetical protein FJW86_10330 [Actinobacteria bacterium]|nr:hypothetical protein [Actinomycetota bacterium]
MTHHRSRKGLLVIIGAIAVTVGLAAPAAAPPPVEVVLTEAQLDAATLLPAEVPGDPGWEDAPAGVLEPEPHTQANDIESGWCGGGTDGYAAGELRVSAVVTNTLQRRVSPDQPSWFIWQTNYTFQEAFGNSPTAQATSFMTTMQTATTGDCTSWMVLGGEIPNSVEPTSITIAPIGQQSFAVQMTTFGDGVSDISHAVYARVANNVAVVHTRIFPADTTLLRKIAKKATKKLKQAAAAAAGP